jgi:hypothetical protein
MDCDQNATAIPKLPGQRVPFRSGPLAALPYLLFALLLIMGGLGLRRVALINTDLESLTQLAEDVRTVYASPDSQSGKEGVWWTNHASGLRAWKLGWLAWNQQVDSRVLQLGSLVLHVAAIGLLFFVVAATLPRPWAAPLAVGLILLFETPALAAVSPSADSAWGSGLLILSLLHLVWMSRNPANSWRWWAGLLCGALNLFSASAGLTSALALVIWSALGKADDAAAIRRRRRVLWANALLLVGGVALVLARGKAEGSFAFSFTPASLVTWPFAHAWTALVFWAPAAAIAASAIRHRASFPPIAASLSLLAMWAAAVALFSSAGTQTAFAAVDVLGAIVVVNAACFAALPARDARSRTRNLVLFSTWAILVGNALLHPVVAPDRRPIQTDDALAISLRESLATRNLRLLGQTGLAPEDRLAATELIRNERTHRILPASIRLPMQMDAVTSNPNPAFRSDGYPELPARDRLPASGTWSENTATTTGEFASKPIATPFPLLQFRVAGTLHPPETSLVLRSEDGTEIPPLNGAVSALDKWRRINFAAPRGPFQIVARDSSATEWLAFTAPVEIGDVSRVAGKLPRWWSWLLGCGIALGGGLAVTAWRRAFSAEPAALPVSEPIVNWRVVPWIALCGYAVFFANHLDTVAGPNDSGGYLNLAKTLVDGHVTAAPRMLFGPAAGETDLTPYLTTTFQPRNDGRLVAEYPVGFPLEIWLFAQVLPLRLAVPAVMLLQLVLGIVFTRLLAKAFRLPEGWAWLAGGMVGLSAVYLFQALQPQSDGPALVWVTAAVYWAWSSRTKPWHAVLAGLATALAVLIRPSNLLCLVPVLICLAGNWRQTLGWALAGLPGAAFLAWYNHELYGSWHRTGYGDVGAGFGLHFIPLTLRSYALWLPKYFTPILCLGLAAPFLRSIPGRVRLVLTSWAAVFLAFYAAYWCTWDNWYNMRFILPAAPAMLVLALWVLRQLGERFRLTLFTDGSIAKSLVPSALLGVAIFAFQSAATLEHRVIYWMHANDEHASAARWAGEHLPANAVVLAKPATNPLWYYTDLTFVRSDHPKVRQSPEFLQRIVEDGRPVYALTYHWEQRDFKWDGDRRGTGYPDLPGTWERIAALWEKEIYIWKLTSLRPPDSPPPLGTSTPPRPPHL